MRDYVVLATALLLVASVGLGFLNLKARLEQTATLEAQTVLLNAIERELIIRNSQEEPE